jgi:Zn-dependent protease
LADIDLFQLGISLVILLVSLSIHEAAHAWSADRLGDGTARSLGRVSLNPVVHIDPIGTLLFPIVAMTTGLPVLGWAKPVPVNVRQLGHGWRQKYALIAAAGPISNVILAVVAALLLRALSPGGEAWGLVRGIVALNVFLAVFNLIPFPPLDGGNVLAGLLPGPAAAALDAVRPWGFFILFALMMTGFLYRVIGPPAQFLFSALV